MDNAGDRRALRRQAQVRPKTRGEMFEARRNDVWLEGEERMSGDQKKKPNDPNVVSFERAERKPDPARIAEFSATARKPLRERGSGDVVARLLRETPRDEWPRLAGNEELRNSGALDRLSRDIAAALEKDPTDALAMSNLATLIAETLPAGD